MVITRIERQKNSTQRLNIHIDGEFAFGIHKAVLLRWSLRQGDSLTDQQKRDLMNDEEVHRARLSAMRLLHSRLRSEKELRDRLREKEYARETVDAVVRSLNEAGLLDDARFAEAFCHDRALRGAAGPVLLRRELRMRGVAASIIDRQLARIPDEEQMARAVRTAQAYLRKSPRARTARIPALRGQAVGRYLLRRGFEWSIITKVLKSMFGETDALPGEE